MEENRTILIVDDEPETLKGYAEFLAPAGAQARVSSRSLAKAPADASNAAPRETYKLLLAPSGEKAIEIFKEERAAGRRVAAGFFDVKLEGGIDGLATIQAIKALDPDIHCVIVTAYHDRSVEEIHSLFGEEFKDHWDYLNKPFTQGEIVQKARQMVGAWNRHQKIQALQNELVKSERLAAVGQVARGIGHEFGNILLRIIGKADLAMMEKDMNVVRDHLKVLMGAAERAGVIVRNLQSFAKTEPQLQSIPLSDPLEDALVLIHHDFAKNSVNANKSYNSKTPVRIDKGKLSQVFLNLLINAMHAMPKGGTITITVEDSVSAEGKPGVQARVADTGTGIPPEVLPRIFDYAFTTKGDSGSGLGLSVSKEIVEAHHGAILVKTSLGKGTEFIVWIPRGSS